MADSHTLKMIEHKIDLVLEAGYGEVVVKIKNGYVYRVPHTIDTYIEKPELDKKGG